MVCVGRQSSVDAEYLLIYYCGKRQIVKYVGAILPDVQTAVFPQAFVVEAVNLRYLTGLVVSSQQGYPALVSDFQGQQEDECLNAIQSAIDKISEEEICDKRRVSSYFEELQEIVELSVDVSANGDWRIDTCQVGFFNQYLLSLIAQHLHTGFLYELIVFHLLQDLLNRLQIILHTIQKIYLKASSLWLNFLPEQKAIAL